jgi:hypothetical protein
MKHVNPDVGVWNNMILQQQDTNGSEEMMSLFLLKLSTVLYKYACMHVTVDNPAASAAQFIEQIKKPKRFSVNITGI